MVQQLPCKQEQSLTDITIGTTSSGILYQLKDKYSICRCCCNVLAYKWKIESCRKVSFLTWCLLSISRCTSRYETDLAGPVVCFISCSMGQIRSTYSPKLALLRERTSSILENSLYLFVSVAILTLSTIFLLDFETVPTVWYYMFFQILKLFRQFGIICFSRF